MNTHAAATRCSSGVKSEQTVHEIKPNMTVNGAYRWEKSQSAPSLLPRVCRTRETAAQKQATTSAADRQARTLALLAAFLSVSEIPFGTTLGVYACVVLFPLRGVFPAIRSQKKWLEKTPVNWLLKSRQYFSPCFRILTAGPIPPACPWPHGTYWLRFLHIVKSTVWEAVECRLRAKWITKMELPALRLFFCEAYTIAQYW